MINTVLPITPEAIQTAVEEVVTNPEMEVRKVATEDTSHPGMVTKAMTEDTSLEIVDTKAAQEIAYRFTILM